MMVHAGAMEPQSSGEWFKAFRRQLLRQLQQLCETGKTTRFHTRPAAASATAHNASVATGNGCVFFDVMLPAAVMSCNTATLRRCCLVENRVYECAVFFLPPICFYLSVYFMYAYIQMMQRSRKFVLTLHDICIKYTALLDSYYFKPVMYL